MVITDFFSGLFKNKYSLPVILLIINLLFIITRLIYFVYYPVPGFTKDTFGYYEPAMQIFAGQYPVFDLITPAYPFFLLICKVLSMSTMQTIGFQFLISLITLNIFTVIIWKYVKRGKLIYILFALLFFVSPKFINNNTIINPVTIFNDFIILSALFLFVGAITNKNKFLYIASVLISICILLRPQGLFLIALLIFIIIFYKNFRNRKKIIALFSPFLIIMLILFTYNKLTFNKFAFTNFSQLSSVGSSVFYLEEDENYPKNFNQIIRNVQLSFPDGQLQKFNNTWSYKDLDAIITVKNVDKMWLFFDYFKSNPDLIGKLGLNSKKNHPILYFKFFFYTILKSFDIYRDKYYFYYNELNNRKYFVEKTDEYLRGQNEYESEFIFSEFKDNIVNKTPLLNISGELPVNSSQEPLLVKLYCYYQLFYNLLFQNILFLALFFCTLLFSLYQSIRTKSGFYFLLLCVCLIVILNHVLIAMSVVPISRYVFCTEFFLLLAPIMLSVHLSKNIKPIFFKSFKK